MYIILLIIIVSKSQLVNCDDVYNYCTLYACTCVCVCVYRYTEFGFLS